MKYHIVKRGLTGKKKIRKVTQEPKRCDSFECFGASKYSKPMRETIQQEKE